MISSPHDATGIEPFSILNDPHGKREGMKNYLQKSLSGSYIQSFDELYEMADCIKPSFEHLLNKIKKSVIRTAAEVQYME